MNFLRACALGLALLLACALATPARGADLEVDLLGWRLQQFDSGVRKALGEPWQTHEDGDSLERAYPIGGAAYLVISTDRRAPHYIQALQVTGHDPRPELFAGLHLGDPREKVLAALGPPDRVRPLDIAPVKPLKVDVYEYDARNYTVQLDPQGRLYSVRICTTEAVVGFPQDSSPADPWPAFAAAVNSGSFARLEPLLRPDVEVYRRGDTLFNERRHGDFVAAPPDDLLDAFFDTATGVAVATRQPAPDAYTRLTDKMGVGRVYKFPADSVLQEVVFFPYLGTWRVYEVRFRDDDGTTAGPAERG